MNLYATLDKIKSASYLNLTATTHDEALVDCLEEASRQIDRDTDRFFYIYEGTFFQDGGATRVILDWDVQTISTLKCDTDGDGNEASPSTYESTYTVDINSPTTSPDAFVYPFNTYPKTRLEANPWGQYGHFGSGIRKAIRITGSFGYGNDWPSNYISSSGMVVHASTAGTAFTSTDSILSVSTTTMFDVGMTIRISNGTTAEQMYVEALSTASLTVTRAVNGTVAGPATTDDIVYIYNYPQAIKKACLIYAMRTWKRRESAFQNQVGNPEMGTVTVWKGDDPDYRKTVEKYKKVKRGWYIY